MKKYILLVFIAIISMSCKSKLKPRELGAYNIKTSIVSNSNGNLIVTAFGRGTSKEECEVDALKRALNDVIFRGIVDGNPSALQKPILTSPNAENEYQEFMNTFLSPNGKFTNYVSIYNEPRSQSRSQKIRKLDRVENMAIEFQIQVDRNGLVNLFKNENLKKN